jgi:hypothetical protein
MPDSVRYILGLTGRYLRDPAAAAALNARQTAKLERALTRATEVTNWSLGDTVDYILSVALIRVRFAKPTLYITNVGSSGSHWLNTMLRESLGLLGSGEIYVPAKFLKTEVHAAAPEIRAVFLQAVYAAHLLTGKLDDVTEHVVNTAHLPDLKPYVENDIGSLKILLVRDPADIAVSRTLRKPEYRAYLGKSSMSDEDYLVENITVVHNFYAAVEPKHFDLLCRYEELVNDPVPALKRIADLLGKKRESGRLREIANLNRSNQVHSDALLEAARKAVGDETTQSMAEVARDRLAEVRRKFDYG